MSVVYASGAKKGERILRDDVECPYSYGSQTHKIRSRNVVDLTNTLNQIRRARQTGHPTTAIDLIRRLAGSAIPLANFGPELMTHALALGDEDGALEVAKAIVREAPENLQNKLTLAERYSRVGRSDVALKIVQELKQPNDPNAAIDYFLAVYAGHVGQLEDAITSARSAIQKKPDLGDAWVILASLGGLNTSDQKTLEALVSAPQSKALPGAAYALGALHHSQGNHKKAWEAWTVANAFEGQRANGKVASDIRLMKEIELAFPEPPAPTSMQAAQDGPRPIFVVGAPRSGTSLTEQIIATDTSVQAMGETMFSRVATWPIGNLTQTDLAKARANSASRINWPMMGNVYKTLAAIRSQSAANVTDKGALLHLFVGALARSLPEAKFVWVCRDKRDVFLSAYRSNFTAGAHWRHTAADAAAFLNGHDEIMRHWQTLMPDRVHRLDYEALVTDPKSQIEQLMTFLGLSAPNTDTLSFSGSTVTTASFAQIRGKISSKSVGGWEAYKDFIPSDF